MVLDSPRLPWAIIFAPTGLFNWRKFAPFASNIWFIRVHPWLKSILRRVQTAGAGMKGDVHPVRVAGKLRKIRIDQLNATSGCNFP